MLVSKRPDRLQFKLNLGSDIKCVTSHIAEVNSFENVELGDVTQVRVTGINPTRDKIYVVNNVNTKKDSNNKSINTTVTDQDKH